LLNGALLAEANLLQICNNNVIITSCSSEQQNNRLLNREYSPQEISHRKASQWDFYVKKSAIERSVAGHSFGHLWLKDTSLKPDVDLKSNTENIALMLEQIVTQTKSESLINSLQKKRETDEKL